MANEVYKKKNYAKFLPKAGGAAAAALVMTVALSTQAHAAEVYEINYQPLDNPPVDAGAAVKTAGALELPGVNESVAQANEQTAIENEQTA